MSPTHVLFEFASGYAIFEKIQVDEITLDSSQMQDSFLDLERFSRILKLNAFFPFKNAAHALENINDVSEGVLNDYLKECLEINLSAHAKDSGKKKSGLVLGVLDKNLAGSIRQSLGIECESGTELVNELVRAIRYHGYKLFGQFKKGDFEKAQLGLGHSYSRAKVKFNVNRSDNMIIQSICLLDQMDKDINTFAMRVREWYSWHFPELAKLVTDNCLYARLVMAIQNKQSLDEGCSSRLEQALDEANRDKAPLIVEAAKSSMGTDISELDMLNITNFARRVVSLTEYRNRLSAYLSDKMSIVAPNLASLIGDVVGARLISRAGSLTNLSKAPASTVQILGAEKALFRALKTKGKTPKYGIIYHSTFIGKAGSKNKGRISRYLANKCSIASRIDCFSDVPCSVFGEALKKQVDERLQFYEDGHCPRTNLEVMHEANLAAVSLSHKRGMEEEPKASVSKKLKEQPTEVSEPTSEKKSKKDKKEKKEKDDKKGDSKKEKEKEEKIAKENAVKEKDAKQRSEKKESKEMKKAEEEKSESLKKKKTEEPLVKKGKSESTESKSKSDAKKEKSESRTDKAESKKDRKESSESSKDKVDSEKDKSKSKNGATESKKESKDKKSDSKKDESKSKDKKKEKSSKK